MQQVARCVALWALIAVWAGNAGAQPGPEVLCNEFVPKPEFGLTWSGGENAESFRIEEWFRHSLNGPVTAWFSRPIFPGLSATTVSAEILYPASKVRYRAKLLGPDLYRAFRVHSVRGEDEVAGPWLCLRVGWTGD